MLAIAGTSVLAVAVGVLSTAKFEAWGDGSAVLAAARGSGADAVVAVAIGAAALMSIAAVCSSAALVSGAMAASFSVSAELAIGVSAGVLLFRASFSGAAATAATGSAIFDSDGCAVATWLASTVAVAVSAIALALTTDDSPRIAGDTRSKFQKVLFIFLTPSHSYSTRSAIPNCSLLWLLAC